MTKAIIRSDVNNWVYRIIGDHQMAEMWWNIPNQAFDNRTPQDVYTGTEQERQALIEYVSKHLAGISGESM